MHIDLKPLFRERGLTQKDAAFHLGVSEPTISEWLNALREGRHRRVPAESARPLAKLLNLSPAVIRPDLFGEATP